MLRRAVASGIKPRKIVDAMTVFSGSSRIEGVHPLQFGYVRRKIRTQRRHGMPIVNPLVFYPWRAFDFVKVAAQWAALALRYRAILRRVLADKDGAAYVDEALAPVDAKPTTTHDFVAAFRRQDPRYPRRAETGGSAGGGMSALVRGRRLTFGSIRASVRAEKIGAVGSREAERVKSRDRRGQAPSGSLIVSSHGSRSASQRHPRLKEPILE